MNGRLLASRIILTAVLVGFQAWFIAAVIRRASGHHGNVTPTQFLAGALVIYLGCLLWAVSVAAAVYVVYPRSGPRALFSIGRGPRLARVNLGKGSVEWRLWSAVAGYRALTGEQSVSLRQERRLLRTALWPGFAAGAVVAALAVVLPGRGWILVTAVVCGVQSAGSLLTPLATGPIAQLRAMKAYPGAIELGTQARAAMMRRDYEQALELASRALAEPHDSRITREMHVFAGSACMQLGRFVDAVGHLELALNAIQDENAKATIRGDIADAKLTEVLRTRTPIPQAEVKQLRAWIDATPPAATEAAKAAFAHRLAMLRLLEGDPADAVALCESTLPWLDAQPEGRTRPDWQLVAATLVIAYARAGRENDARKLLAELLSTHPLTAAATAELSTAIGDSAQKA